MQKECRLPDNTSTMTYMESWVCVRERRDEVGQEARASPGRPVVLCQGDLTLSEKQQENSEGFLRLQTA